MRRSPYHLHNSSPEFYHGRHIHIRSIQKLSTAPRVLLKLYKESNFRRFNSEVFSNLNSSIMTDLSLLP